MSKKTSQAIEYLAPQLTNLFFHRIAKGTSSFGKRHNKSHTLCRRCGEFSQTSFLIPFHIMYFPNTIYSRLPRSPTKNLTKNPYSPQVAAPSTSRNTPAHHAATQLLRSVNVLFSPTLSAFLWSVRTNLTDPVDNWGMKAKRRKTTGTGRMRTLKNISRKFQNGFQIGAPKGAKGPIISK